MDNGMLYMLAPEGSDTTVTNAIWRYSFPHQQWSRFVFNEINVTTGIRSIFNNPDGALLIGDGAGNVWTLEDTSQDDGNDILIDILTPIADGGQPLLYKDPMDVQLHVDTGGSTVTLSLLADAIASASAPTYDVSSLGRGIWRAQTNDLGKFIKSQLSLTGSVGVFALTAYNLSYRPRPQRMLRLDTGSVIAPSNADASWPQEVEFDAIVDSSTFTMELYFNDVLSYTKSVTATVGKRDVYQIPLPRESKGERPRLVFYVSDDETSSVKGFDPYMVRLRLTASGNQDSDRQYLPMFPAGQAP
jgi:hypothetical protein